MLRKLQMASAPTGTGTRVPTAASAPGIGRERRNGQEMPHLHHLVSLGFVLYNFPLRRNGSALSEELP